MNFIYRSTTTRLNDSSSSDDDEEEDDDDDDDDDDDEGRITYGGEQMDEVPLMISDGDGFETDESDYLIPPRFRRTQKTYFPTFFHKRGSNRPTTRYTAVICLGVQASRGLHCTLNTDKFH